MCQNLCTSSTFPFFRPSNFHWHYSFNSFDLSNTIYLVFLSSSWGHFERAMIRKKRVGRARCSVWAELQRSWRKTKQFQKNLMCLGIGHTFFILNWSTFLAIGHIPFDCTSSMSALLLILSRSRCRLWEPQWNNLG